MRFQARHGLDHGRRGRPADAGRAERAGRGPHRPVAHQPGAGALGVPGSRTALPAGQYRALPRGAGRGPAGHLEHPRGGRPALPPDAGVQGAHDLPGVQPDLDRAADHPAPRTCCPRFRRDPATLQRKNMSVLDHQGRRSTRRIDWASSSGAHFPYMIRQEPGPTMRSGRVKFMYPNPHHVYMHDTPARGLFARAERTSARAASGSSTLRAGAHPAGGTEWDDAAIERVLASGRTRVVNLPQPITVLTLYGTAVPEATGFISPRTSTARRTPAGAAGRAVRVQPAGGLPGSAGAVSARQNP
jgi:hypothetical protein